MKATHLTNCERPWTIGLVAAMSLANLGLWIAEPLCQQVLECLQFDRAAILTGELWRLVTGNLVHWSAEHCLLDVAAFAILGWIYEPPIRRQFQQSNNPLRILCSLPAVLLATSCGVGLTVFFLQPAMLTYRGLSGVDSGLFALALILECTEAKNDSTRWWYVIPAVLVFIVKLVFEVTTGSLFFGTESLGDLGQPVPLAHLAGAVFAVACCLVCATRNSQPDIKCSSDVRNSSELYTC